MSDNTHRKSISEYVGWLFKQYQQAQQELKSDAYRIVDHNTDKDGQHHLTIQIVGKSVTFKSTPQKILADDDLVEHFSRKDIRTITYLACQDLEKPKHRIILQEFCQKLNRLVFGVKNPKKDEVLRKMPSEISQDKELLKTLSQEDAHLVGYATATEQMNAEKEAISSLSEINEIETTQ